MHSGECKTLELLFRLGVLCVPLGKCSCRRMVLLFLGCVLALCFPDLYFYDVYFDTQNDHKGKLTVFCTSPLAHSHPPSCLGTSWSWEPSLAGPPWWVGCNLGYVAPAQIPCTPLFTMLARIACIRPRLFSAQSKCRGFARRTSTCSPHLHTGADNIQRHMLQ